MPNGRPGDHPLTDIVVHGQRVYSERVDALVREIAALAGPRVLQELAELLTSRCDELSHPDVPELEHELQRIRERLQGRVSRGDAARPDPGPQGRRGTGPADAGGARDLLDADRLLPHHAGARGAGSAARRRARSLRPFASPPRPDRGQPSHPRCKEIPVASADQTMMKVQRILTGPMGLRIQLHGDNISVQFTDVSTRVNLSVQEWGKNSDGDPASLVRLSCPILWEVDPSPGLFEWVAKEGGNFFFGHVSAHDDSTSPGKLFLVMSHTLLGDYLDEGELSSAMYAMLGTADNLDDQLQQRFGGKRLSDY